MQGVSITSEQTELLHYLKNTVYVNHFQQNISIKLLLKITRSLSRALEMYFGLFLSLWWKRGWKKIPHELQESAGIATPYCYV